MSKTLDIDLEYLGRALAQQQGYLDPKVQKIFRDFYWTYTDEKARDKNYRSAREEITRFISDLLWSGRVALVSGYDTQFLDEPLEKDTYARRFPISQVIIHHSSTGGDVTLRELNAHGFLEKGLYLHHFSSNTPRHGMPVFSGHRFDRFESSYGGPNSDVFFAYTHVIRPNGTSIRLLQDTDVGWHSGDWLTNLLSVGICILGDFSKSQPSDQAIQTAKQIIEQQYSGATVKGHREIISTACPGNDFLGDNGWKRKLTNLT